jgi:hypothetical protein
MVTSDSLFLPAKEKNISVLVKKHSRRHTGLHITKINNSPFKYCQVFVIAAYFTKVAGDITSHNGTVTLFFTLQHYIAHLMQQWNN